MTPAFSFVPILNALILGESLEYFTKYLVMWGVSQKKKPINHCLIHMDNNLKNFEEINLVEISTDKMFEDDWNCKQKRWRLLPDSIFYQFSRDWIEFSIFSRFDFVNNHHKFNFVDHN